MGIRVKVNISRGDEVNEPNLKGDSKLANGRSGITDKGGKIMDGITASEVAGLGVGAILFCVTVAAPKVDAFISASQRRCVFLLLLDIEFVVEMMN